MSGDFLGTPPDPDAWSDLLAQLNELGKQVRSHLAATVGKQSIRDQTRAVVQQFFRLTRPHLRRLGFTDAELAPLDEPMQELLRLANTVSSKRSYTAAIRSTRRALDQIELSREMRLGVATSTAALPGTEPSVVERAIIETLKALLPGAALGYQQALRDIANDDRLSYRGVAAELREVVREVLDRLAPDGDLKTAGVTIEKDQTGYTQKQKVRYLLRSRGLPDNARKAPEESVRLIEELTASLTRSVYVRGSISTHVTSPAAEVRQLKLYVDGVLGELLEIHQRRD
jgi:Predicted pPIWI-associating nuclease